MHTRPDDGSTPAPPAEYIAQALAQGISIIGITDHNTCANVESFLQAGSGAGILVVPGIEVTTNEGHLLALFDGEHLDELTAFAAPTNLQLTTDPLDRSVHAARSMLDLISEIDRRGGLAIAAHVDAADGIAAHMSSSALRQLLLHPGLAALEFADSASLDWFSEADSDASRKGLWRARERSPLGVRGLARVMSSDAHSPGQVGRDRQRRVLTRVRVDELSFEAIRSAIVLNPRARCKPEAILPPDYPRVTRARFEGGFLDGVDISLSPNLNCFIGGRGSGKSTALIAIRAALGAPTEDEDPDLPERMPDRTIVHIIDELGSERVCVRERGSHPADAETGAPIYLPLADLGQDESGRLAREYTEEPSQLLAFLDQFCDLRAHDNAESELLDALEENQRIVLESSPRSEHEHKTREEFEALTGSLEAAQKGRLEELANLAGWLTTHGPLIEELEELLAAAAARPATVTIDIDALAQESGAQIDQRPASDFVVGEDGLRARLSALGKKTDELAAQHATAVRDASGPAREKLDAWRRRHKTWQEQLQAKRTELEALGLKVQAGEVERLAKRLEAVRAEIKKIDQRRQRHKEARSRRRELLVRLRAERDNRFRRRQATLDAIVKAVNAASTGLRLAVKYEHEDSRANWCEWLRTAFGFRAPRVERLAAALSPATAAEMIQRGRDAFIQFRAPDGEAFFDRQLVDERWPDVAKWQVVFDLETMRLDDRPRIRVREPGGDEPREFDELSAGQQRSILLGLILCAERNQPLVLDQPEDHLDSEYIASAVVGHLEHAKERRQIIIATHSANLTVLGDAELVLPMQVDGRHGRPAATGGIDRAETRQRVCALLEGGEAAYTRRGERYGFKVEKR